MGTQTTNEPTRKVKAENVEIEGTGRMGRGKGMPGLPPGGTGANRGKPTATPPQGVTDGQ